MGTSDKNIDILDNPFIKFNVYEVDDAWEAKLSDKIKLKKCTQSDLEEFMDKNVTKIYHTSMCFENYDSINLQNSYYDGNFKSVYVSVDAC